MMKKVKMGDDYEISPVIKGGWQLSSGHSLDKKIDDDRAILDTTEFIEAGISTLDFGDIYTGVEELIGKAILKLTEKYGDDARSKVQLHTKYVPNESELHNFDTSDVSKVIHRSLDRLGVDSVDLVQFHWWKYEAKFYLNAMEKLFDLKSSGKIRNVGVTNFDVERLEQMVNEGLKPASIQLQYSVIDGRAEKEMIDFCTENEISILCYGTVAGGLISERFLGVPDPSVFGNRSQIKYRLIIEEFGGWEIFQELVAALHKISQKYNVDIGTIASAYILSQPGIKAVIVGARNLDHLSANLQIPEIQFSEEDINNIQRIRSRAKGPLGPIYNLERYDDKHRNIMHTNNN